MSGGTNDMVIPESIKTGFYLFIIWNSKDWTVPRSLSLLGNDKSELVFYSTAQGTESQRKHISWGCILKNIAAGTKFTDKYFADNPKVSGTIGTIHRVYYI